MNRLKRHPFPVVAHFDRVVAVSFAFPVATLRPLVPEGLKIDAFGDFGFVTAALVWTRDLRPAGFPKFLGQDFFLAGYRIFTRLRDESEIERHDSGLALRFSPIKAVRRDKTIDDIDTIQSARVLL